MKKLPTFKVIGIFLIFIIVLTCFRLVWLNTFKFAEQPIAQNGVLDLSEWGELSDSTVELKGEWAFYPNEFLDYEQDMREDDEDKLVYLPASWKEHEHSIFGYGTYQLTIKVDPTLKNQYSFYIPKVNSAAEVYINGELYQQIGTVGTNRESYKPSNVPHTIYFTHDGVDEIELVLYVANFDDPISGGMTAPIQFGFTENIESYQDFTMGMALLACAIYLLHAIYSFILYIMSKRIAENKRLLYFALILLLIIFTTLITENLFFLWFPTDYAWGIKSINMVAIIGGYLVFKLISPYKLLVSNPTWSKFYYIYLVVVFILTIVLPVHTIDFLNYLSVSAAFLPCVLALFFLYQSIVKIDRTNIFLFLGLTAAVYSLIWLIIIENFQIKFISYPFDLIIAIICFAIYIFNYFFRILGDSQRMAAELQETDKMKDRFLVSVAHEMKNPLNGILGISQAIAHSKQHVLDDTTIRDLHIINSIGQRMSMMLNDLLELERLKYKNFIISPRATSIRAVSDSIIDMFRFITMDTDITLINKIPSDFPLVFADENRVSQILFNLVHNAVKFSEKGNIVLEATTKDGWASISVRDQGIGIDAQLLDDIFQPYKQEESAHVYESGIGLGLNICKQLVELHGGKIQAHSTKDEGSIFTFTLRLSTESVYDVQRELVTKQPLTENAQHVATLSFMNLPQHVDINMQSQDIIKILAVDDDLMNLKVLESLFSSALYEIHTVDNAKGALALIATKDWDIVISDVAMPYMTGYELTEKIREKYSVLELPILLLTAYTKEESIETGFLLGANDYIAKPLNRVELFARVNSLVRMKKSVEQRLHMEAAWLQAQIRPHFIINTFNSIAALGRIDLERMDLLIEQLTKYIRLSINSTNYEKTVPIKRELELVESYATIQKERFGDRIQVVCGVDKQLHFELPPLSIQTLVENAISHGILKKPKGGEVKVIIERVSEGYKVMIQDNGVGMHPDKCEGLLKEESNNKGIGLINTNRRLQQLYGKGLVIESKVGQGTTISYIIPIINE